MVEHTPCNIHVKPIGLSVLIKCGSTLFKVCREWKEIAFVTRYKVFKETEQGEIDLFDIKVCIYWNEF